MKLSSSGAPVVRFLAIILLALIQARFSIAQQGSPASSAPVATQTAPVSASYPVLTKENFDSLTLKGSDLIPEKPVLGEKDEMPEFTRELIQVHWRFADPIDLY